MRLDGPTREAELALSFIVHCDAFSQFLFPRTAVGVHPSCAAPPLCRKVRGARTLCPLGELRWRTTLGELRSCRRLESQFGVHLTESAVEGKARRGGAVLGVGSDLPQGELLAWGQGRRHAPSVESHTVPGQVEITVQVEIMVQGERDPEVKPSVCAERS